MVLEFLNLHIKNNQNYLSGKKFLVQIYEH
jgi:hypothetical protein